MDREEVAGTLRSLEEKHGMTSEVFYELWKAGESPVEGIDKLRWVAFLEVWRRGRYLVLD
jgi:hypothetical protein